ncbi:uncharacterized protein LDX57_005371 [Aspergillus melleus]|uniref:uncharacterized protein n=1 Tax=Aspergillus melleus TaxID=138277 RepID=UPI001E8EEA55|nr:uncharacterized protein LDX57_005371 [Aspergillus melleus]KAH8427660.1 hypothetical protein LDX57_005371 [Aspergillus melleus]
MPFEDRSSERSARRTSLKVVRKKINKLGNGYLDDSDLKAAGVNRQPMSLEENAILPRFFAPYKGMIVPPQDQEAINDLADSFPRFDKLIFEDRADSAQHFVHEYIQSGILPQDEEFPLVPQYKDWGKFGFPDLVEILGKPTWQFMTAWHMPLRNQPHIKCMLCTDIVAEDRLLYSEMVSILEIIRQRLRARETRLHIDAPVSLPLSLSRLVFPKSCT